MRKRGDGKKCDGISGNQQHGRLLSEANSLEFNAENTIFAFDFHNVVVRQNVGRMLKDLLLTKQGLQFFALVLFLHPLLLLSTIIRIFTLGFPTVTEEFWFYLVKRHKYLHSFTPLFSQIVNSYRLDEGTLTVIAALKKKQYKIFLFSNIGGKFWKDTEKRYKSFFEHFDGFLVSTEENGYVSKPSHLAYNHFHKSFNVSNLKVIFVDDSASNVKASSSNPYFYGYLFKTSEHLARDFANWGII